MRELKFEGLSADGATLILVGKDGQKWSVTIDERIEAAVRRDRARIGQVEIEQSGELRPREIQARIRAGATAEDVAASSGLSLEHIRRFEGPVLTERAWVALQAQSTEVRRPGEDIRLGDLVVERLDAEGVDPDHITWDAWRGDDGTWVVIATFPIGPNTHVATWTYDSGSRTMTVVDANARGLCSIDTGAPLNLTASRPNLAPVEQPATNEGHDAVVTALRTRASADSADTDAPDDREDTAEPDSQSSNEAAAASASEGAATDGDTSQEPDEATPDIVEVADIVAPSAANDADEPAAGDSDPVTEQAGTAEEGDKETVDEDDEGLFAAPATAQRTARKRSVPSFDDILFGPGPGSSSK